MGHTASSGLQNFQLDSGTYLCHGIFVFLQSFGNLIMVKRLGPCTHKWEAVVRCRIAMTSPLCPTECLIWA